MLGPSSRLYRPSSGAPDNDQGLRLPHQAIRSGTHRTLGIPMVMFPIACATLQRRLCAVPFGTFAPIGSYSSG